MTTPPTPPALCLFDLTSLESAFAANSFDQEELVSLLIGHARSHKPMVAIAAIRSLMDYGKQSLTASGALAQTTLQESHNGRTLSVTHTTAISRLTASRPSRLPFAHGQLTRAEPVPSTPLPLADADPEPARPTPAPDVPGSLQADPL